MQARMEFLTTLCGKDSKLARYFINPSPETYQDCQHLFHDCNSAWRFELWQHYQSPRTPPPDHPECYRQIPGPVGWPTFEMLMFAKLEHRRRQFQESNCDNVTADALTEKKRTTRIKKAILTGKLSVSLTFPDPYAFLPEPDSPVEIIEKYLGLKAKTAKDQAVLCALWEGQRQFSANVPENVSLTRQISLLEKDLGETAICHAKSEGYQAVELSFLLRYQSHHTPDVWLTCLNLSAAANLADIWTLAVMEKLDPVPSITGNLSEESLNLTRNRHNWPNLFLAILFEHGARRVVPWKHAEAALSLFFNAILSVKGAEFTREFVAHLTCLHLSHYRRIFRLTSNKHVIKTLRALFARTYFPSIFCADDHASNYAACYVIHLEFTKLVY